MKRTLDVRGLRCPVPVVRTGEALREIEPGTELLVVADDPWVIVDLRAYCDANRHEYLGHVQRDGLIRLQLRKAEG